MADNAENRSQQIINVKKSNSLIESIGKTTLLSNKVFLTSLLKIEYRSGAVTSAERSYYKKIESLSGTDFSRGLVAEFRNTDLRRIMGTNSGSYYTHIAELMDPKSKNSLRNQWVIMVKDPESKLYGTSDVITATLYDEKAGKLYIKFSSEKKIQEALYDLKGNYTMLNYSLMMTFKSIYSYRIYELLVSRVGKEDAHNPKRMEYCFTYGLSELKYLLGILDPYINKDVKTALMQPNPDYERIEEMLSTEHVMPRYNDFKKYTLEKARKEINEKTEWEFEFAPVRSGRGGKVVAVDLTLRRKHMETPKQIRKLLSDDEKDDILDTVYEMIDERIRMKDARAICEAAEYDLEKIKKAYDVMKESPAEIKNVVGFMVKAIKEGYDTGVKTAPKKTSAGRSKNRFNNFEQREYDYDELEKMMFRSQEQK